MKKTDKSKRLHIEGQYDFENLKDTFIEHAEQAELNNYELLEKFKENYPDAPIPDHFINPFNIARALSVICEEVEKLKTIVK